MAATPARSTSSSMGLVGTFAEQHAGIVADGSPPGGEVAPIDKRGGDAEARQNVLDHRAAGAEHRLRRHDVIARFEATQQRGRHRRHAGRGRASILGAFEKRHARLKHTDRGVGEPRVGEALVVVLEEVFRLRRAGISKARIHEQRFGCFAELRAKRAAVNEKRFGMKLAFGVRPCPLSCGANRKSRAPEGRRPFSKLFNVAASRPAKDHAERYKAPARLARQAPPALPLQFSGELLRRADARFWFERAGEGTVDPLRCRRRRISYPAKRTGCRPASHFSA